MPRRNSRAPLRAPDLQLTRFVRDNVKDPDRALADMNSSPPTPDRPPVTPADLLAQPRPRSLNAEFNQGPGTFEVNGPDYTGPKVRILHSAAAHSPAPHVSTADPADHAYHAAGSGAVVVPGGPAMSDNDESNTFWAVTSRPRYPHAKYLQAAYNRPQTAPQPGVSEQPPAPETVADASLTEYAALRASMGMASAGEFVGLT